SAFSFCSIRCANVALIRLSVTSTVAHIPPEFAPQRTSPMLHNAKARRPSASSRVDFIGVPTDAGASRRGAVMGPMALRVAELAQRLAELGYAVEDRGDLSVPRHLPAAAEIDALARLSSAAGYESLEGGARPIFLG